MEETKREQTPAPDAEISELLRKTACGCMVLLENDGVLPLPAGKRIALFGSGARMTVKGGLGSGDVNSVNDDNIEQGLVKGGFVIASRPWLDRFDRMVAEAKEAHAAMIAGLVEKNSSSYMIEAFLNPFSTPAIPPVSDEDIRGSQTDTAVYILSRNAGEGADRWAADGDYYLSAEDRSVLKKLTASYEKVVVVLNIGGVMDLAELKGMKGISALLLMTQLGTAGAGALADILSGKANPSGKLTDTWAARYEDYPSSACFSHNNGDVDDDDYNEGIYVGYRYFETAGVKPVYPFGYGLSYTDFEILPGAVSAEDEQVCVNALVRNTGSRAGREVVQVYVSAPCGSLDKPLKELKAFQKTEELKPGECAELQLSFAVRDLASYSEQKAAWVLEKGDYVVLCGSSSTDCAPAAVLRLEQEVVTEQLKNLFRPDVDFAEIRLTRQEICAGDMPVITLDADAIRTKTAVYSVREEFSTAKTEKLMVRDVLEGRCTLEELVAQLTVEEMAELCVGTQRAESNEEVIGNASQRVPGAAGETSFALEESRGIPGTVNADGPAGLRLQAHYRTDLEGKLLPGGQGFAGTEAPFPEMPEGSYRDHYQYCTAIPIGWALAQSWDPEMITELADIVGSEMVRFNVDIWLAPALNIHRNPLCGRNFEYYSEDPLISGRVAAAITRGVQRYPGKGVTIKHFACNNQEDNRYFTNAHVGERAMREIYLKGFEICVREAAPMAVMTSYNLVNGIHTANSRDLNQYALRDEWGFRGFVMTDWFTSQELPVLTGGRELKYSISSSPGCIYAGNDLQEPGCRQNVDDIVKSVREGAEIRGFSCTLADLQFCAANIIRAVVRCRYKAEF